MPTGPKGEKRPAEVNANAVLWIRPMSQGRPNPSASSFVVADQVRMLDE